MAWLRKLRKSVWTWTTLVELLGLETDLEVSEADGHWIAGAEQTLQRLEWGAEEKGRKRNLISGLHIVGQAVHLHYLDRTNIGIPEKTSIYWMKWMQTKEKHEGEKSLSKDKERKKICKEECKMLQQDDQVFIV